MFFTTAIARLDSFLKGLAMFPNSIPDWLQEHRGVYAPQPFVLTTARPDGSVVSGTFSAIEGLGCSVRELRIAPAPESMSRSLESLRETAGRFTEKLAWLPEKLALIEADAQSTQVLLRSETVVRTPEGAGYHEAVLNPAGLRLQRYVKPANGAREPVEMAFTWETFERFVSDASDALTPSTTPVEA